MMQLKNQTKISIRSPIKKKLEELNIMDIANLYKILNIVA